MRYLLNSAVITAEGTYTYTRVSPDDARRWYAAGPVVSTIGYAETAAFAAEILGSEVAVDRRIIRMEVDDEALVIRIALPPGSPRINPGDKGALGRVVLEGHFELGILRRIA